MGLSNQAYAHTIADLVDDIFRQETTPAPAGLGFNPPPSDDYLSDGTPNDGNGDNDTNAPHRFQHTNKIDIYILDPILLCGAIPNQLCEVYGAAVPSERAPDGRRFGYIMLSPLLNRDELAKFVLAHEIHHLIQFGYRNRVGEPSWLFESTSNWVAAEVYPDIGTWPNIDFMYARDRTGLGVI